MTPGFESFSLQHFSALFAFGILAVALIQYGKKSGEPLKTNLGLAIAFFTFSILLVEAIVKLAYGIYDIYVDLPFFLCDLVGVMIPFILLSKNRKWLGILYFWTLAGTFQALLTPDLEEGYPSFHFFRYFSSHAGVVMTVLYAVLVWRIRIGWNDFLNAVIYAQVYLVLVHLINHLLGSNYSYTLQKPPNPTVLDMLGPWPWYIFWGEILMIALFLILLIPFLVKPGVETAELENRS